MIDGEKLKDTISHTAFTVGAPLTGGSIGILSFFEKITPALTVLSLIVGMILGIWSFILKMKLIKKQLRDKDSFS